MIEAQSHNVKPSTRRRLIAAGCLLFTWVALHQAAADTLYVATNGLHVMPYYNWSVAATDIQSAINVADDGDTILVADGTYTGSGNRNISFLGKSITVISVNGASRTIIDCQGLSRAFLFSSGETATSVLSGFTLTNGRASNSSGAGIHLSGTSPLIENCIIKNGYNSGSIDSVGGIYGSGASPTIRRCRIQNNYGVTSGGILLSGGSPLIENCLIASNSYKAVYSHTFASPVIQNCTIIDHLEGVYSKTGSSPSVLNSIVWGCGISGGSPTVNNSCVQGGFAGTDNLDSDPQFVPGTEWHLAASSPCVDAATPGPQVDLDGKRRPVDGDSDGLVRPDIGAFEYDGLMSLVIAGIPHEQGKPFLRDYGVHRAPINSLIVNRITSPADEANGTRYVCTGWSGTGNIPVSQTNHTVAFILTTNTTVTWQWQPEYALSLFATNGNITGAEAGWKSPGYSCDLTPVPDGGHAFVQWNVNGTNAGSTIPLTIVMEEKNDVAAVFTP